VGKVIACHEGSPPVGSPFLLM